MADQKISERTTTSDKTGGYLVINSPDAGSPTGFTTKIILVDNYDADLLALINQNTTDITTLNSDLNTLSNNTAVKRDIIPTQTTNYEYTHRAGSQVVKITIISNVNSTVKCGTTLGGSEIFNTVNTTTTKPFHYESLKEELYNSNISDETLYFTITGSIKIWINYEQLT